MNLPDKLLVILVATAASWPLAPAVAVEGAATHSVAAVLYRADDAEFRALIADASRVAPDTGISAEPVCVPALAEALARTGASVAEGQPARAMGRVLAGPVAGAHAAQLPRAAGESAAQEQQPLATPPAPAGWQLLLCGLAIIGLIAVRRAGHTRG